MSKFYVVRLEAIQTIVLDAESEEEARRLSMENPDGIWEILDAEIEGRDLTKAQVEMELRHGAYDLRSEEATR